MQTLNEGTNAGFMPATVGVSSYLAGGKRKINGSTNVGRWLR